MSGDVDEVVLDGELGPDELTLDEVRVCNGGPHGERWCGDRATVVVSEKPNPDDPISTSFPLQWFACDNTDHQEEGTTEPIGTWFAKLRELRARHGAGER